VIISTWDEGQKVNRAAWPLLCHGKGLDAIEEGGRWIENQINCCVGLGGNPDREGIVTLDAAVMTGDLQIGSVAAVERIKHPITLARQVMEYTPHVLLVGQGAQLFAIEKGHTLEPQELSPDAAKQYQAWLKEKRYNPQINVEKLQMPLKTQGGHFNHDTMAIIAIDSNNRMSGGVTTSGMGFKMRGRVGDSPIIGAGLYVDDQAGAATSSGMGEEVIRVCGSHTVVEFMRHGKSPQQACKATVERIVRAIGSRAKDLQVGFIAINNKGRYGAFAIQPGFTYAVKTTSSDQIFESDSWFT
jgi:N4-(beta-N-acetylglucosaminyl)-L-asparaginase